MRILIVEDEEKTALHLRKGLAEINIVSDLSHNGIDGLTLAMKGNYDLILLDVMLPGIDGWEVVKRLREGGRTIPVIFLTARDAVDDRITGLQLGSGTWISIRT